MDPMTLEEKRRDIERRSSASRQQWAVGAQNPVTPGGATMQEVELPDGTILEFPAGTPHETMRQATADYWDEQNRKSATQAALLEKAKRERSRRQDTASKPKRDYDQIMKALRGAHEAGDPAAARRLAQMAKEAKQASPTISMKDIRAQYPQYDDLSDQQVLEGLHRKFYSDMDFADFSSRIEGANLVGQGDKSLGIRLWENIVGDDDPTTQNTGEKIGSFLNKAGESLTFGLIGDEASAAAESLLPGVEYETRRDHYRDQERQFTEEHPVAALGAELAPLAIPGVGAMGAAAKGVGLGRAALKGAAVAGTQGATYGFMEGEGGTDQRLRDAGSSGLLSAGLGGAMVPLTRGIGQRLDKNATRKAIRDMVRKAPSADDLKAQAGASYTAGAAKGQVMSADDGARLVDDVTSTLKREGVMRGDGSLITRDPDARHVLDELQDLARYGLDGNQVKPVRETFKAAANDANPARARIGKILLGKYDDAVNRRAPDFREGDRLYSRAKKVEAVDQMTDIADTSDTANALRREFQKADRRQIKGKFGGLTEDEVSGLQRVARGSRLENAARTAGRSAPTSIGSALFTGGIPFSGAALAGSPGLGALAGATALGAGVVGRAVSDRMQRRNAEVIKALMATGGKMPSAEGSELLKRILERAGLGFASRAPLMAGQD